MRQHYRNHRFKSEDLDRIILINRIIDDYSAMGLKLTLRQLYYQLVTKNEIPNAEASYKRLGDLLSNARMAGAVDWDAIEDRGREPIIPSDWPGGIPEVLTAAAKSYRLPRWKGQPKYAELWVEKQALAGVLEPLAHANHVVLMVNKGYSSQSAMHASAMRYIQRCSFPDGMKCSECDGLGVAPGNDSDSDDSVFTCFTCSGSGEVRPEPKEPWLFYLGDHDPSGEDMVRDIKSRMTTFGVTNIRVFKIALTMAQIDKYAPPPNPAKLSDSRAAAYVEKHGDSSWEVDALPPPVLSKIVQSAFDRIIDRDAMDEVIRKEQSDIATLKKLAERYSS